jgi:predicted Zn-dependent protease with MMP-like domain
MAYHVSKAQFSELVEQAIALLPEQFATFLEEVPLEVRDRLTPTLRKTLGFGPRARVLGLYRGRPLTTRSVENSGTMPDVIYIFQEEIELASDDEADLIEQVRITVLHEIGHLFGMGEDELKELGYG